MARDGLDSGVALSVGGIRARAELAAEAERLGYGSVWLSEVNGDDAITAMCAAASATTQIRIGTGIVSIYARDPLLMAMTANSLTEHSDGRVILGFGTSTAVVTEKWHGLRWDNPLGRTREYVDLFRQLLRGERVKHQGLYTLAGSQMAAAPRGDVPVYLGALNPAMLQLAGEIADGVILNFPTLAYARRALEHVERGIRKAGRERADVNVTAFLRTTVTGRPESVIPRFRAELLSYVLAPVYRRVFAADGYSPNCDRADAAWAAGDRAAAAAAITDEMVHDHAVIGEVWQCARRIDEFRALGIDNAVVFPIPEPDSAEGPLGSVIRTIRSLAPAAVPV